MSDVVVICYHAISERWTAPLSVSPAQLRQHLDVLTKRGYRGVTFSEAVAGASNGARAAITFDDAYRSVAQFALPILSEAGFPGTVFAPTSFVGREEPMSWPGIDGWSDTEFRDELIPMAWEELELLAQRGWEIGSHTRSHPYLPRLGPEVLATELGESLRAIEERLGRCDSLAYPYGGYDERVVDAARRAGYLAAGTLPSELRWSGDPLEHPRIGVYHADDKRRFRIKISRLVRRARTSRAWTLIDAARLPRRPRTSAPDATATSARD